MQRAIVFGATGGIGQAICTDLASAGWSLYVHCSQNWQKACTIAQKLSRKYPQQDFIPVKLNFLAKNDELKEFVNGLLPVNAAVFAQGITDYNFVSSQSLTRVDEILQVNLTVPVKLIGLLEPALIKNDYSRIVFLGSVYGGSGSAMEAVYSTSKAGLARFAQAYAREVASANLTVNVVAPGAVNTAMNSMLAPEAMEEVKGEIPAGRLAEGKDISYWVKTLLDAQSSYLTGQTIYVSGGWLI
ncbi:3-oxoacyl-ACP reductase [Lactobacillus helsingborgensis]|uniref:SDR family NAD(P)-dependent oxidoreductase n=1 Tax=Lactobacillus helsingborgensis TaxID=1218494 RepID=A0A0F4M4I9_9LACO|nr:MULTISPECIES: SDR family NAD(P)-dependent oxidoreductase [Lactobacillus]AWN33189.1 KR domain-containing protein [Lactobacillus helsingborgensis]KJY65468.1 3-oxoacyl-ACP reductase [Lactobacillus helsingborgensis]MBC6356358.1 SDR family NAD(P)-dependent oxidoreductase [Lactobacillus helsingborgensis]MCT6827161.1 SDR family NAD(P)-dependent oxidoreductase [Lactobacillus helsingborgensis]MCT6846323.1 SDR family NAD(P)-dependent oxidoreductase [Lactobacillus helsingborgensis]